jgi:hypothetical protein
VADDIADQIIHELPSRVHEYQKLDQDARKVGDDRAHRFRIAWEPTIRFALATFDELAEQFQKRGFAIMLKSDDAFPIADTGGVREYEVRVAKLGSASLALVFRNSWIGWRGATTGELDVVVQPDLAKPFHIVLTEDQAPTNGIPLAGQTDAIKAGIAKGFELFLLRAGANAHR